MFEMNSKNKRFFDRRLIRYPVTVRFERISSNVTASEKKKVKKDLLSIRIQKEANKTTKNGLSIQLTSVWIIHTLVNFCGRSSFSYCTGQNSGLNVDFL